MRCLQIFLLLLIGFLSLEVNAACTDTNGDGLNGDVVRDGGKNYAIYTGNCTDDNEVLIQTGDSLTYDACFLMSTTGAVDVFVALDGTNYATDPLSLTDNGAADTNPVIVTAALRIYSFATKFWKIRVLQNGATDAAASLVCWEY